jgi:hypothetical protein
MKQIHLYFRLQRKDRFIPGDRYIIPIIKKILGKKPRISGVKKVFDNLCKGFDLLGINYDVNLPFNKIKPGEPVVVLGSGKYGLDGYKQPNPVIAGIALMTHPSEWPSLFHDYPVAAYLQHSDWANNVYVPFYGKEKCACWPAGIETEKWKPVNKSKTFDFIIYNKIRWNNNELDNKLRLPVFKKLETLGISCKEIKYGHYQEAEYLNLLKECKAMIFLCEHESQGFACCEALSMNVPVFAWDQGFCLDPNRFAWNDPVVSATSVPFFDETCGMTFKNIEDFDQLISDFWSGVNEGRFNPREYVLKNISLEKSAERMIEIIKSVYK